MCHQNFPPQNFLDHISGGGSPRYRAARGKAYPSRPVRIIMGFAAGASGDIAARVLAQALEKTLGQQFVVENRTGAGSNIATNFVAHSAPDGYTLLQGTVANTINPVITANLGSNFQKIFPRSRCLPRLPNIIVVNPALGVHSIQELISLGGRDRGSCRSARRAWAAPPISAASFST